MPHINISLYQGRTKEEQEEICRKLHQAVVESLGFKEEAVSISLTEYTPENFVAAVKENIKDGELIVSSQTIH
ncbi:MAG: tautomerase family protein [Eubacteriales bacterium]